jgi:hypothetical protein
LECLNIRGNIIFVNSVISLTMNESPVGVHETRSGSLFSSSALHGPKG